MRKGELIFTLVFGLVIYGLTLLFFYHRYGNIDLWAEVIIPILAGVIFWVFFGDKLYEILERRNTHGKRQS